MEICVYQFCLPFLQQLKEVSKSIKNICENMKKTLKNYQINKVNIFICVKLQQSKIFVSIQSVLKIVPFYISKIYIIQIDFIIQLA